MDNQTQDISLRDYIRVLFKYKSMILTSMITVCAVVVIGLMLKTPEYEASVKMLITAEKQVEATYYKELYGSRNVEQTLTQSEIVKSDPVIGRVVRSLKLDKRTLADEKPFASALKAKLIDFLSGMQEKELESFPDEQKNALLFSEAVLSLKSNIHVEPIRDTNMFTITVRDYDPVGAAVIANVVSRSYVMFDLEQQLAELRLKYGDKHPMVKLIEESIEKLQATLSGKPLDDVEAIGPASVKIMEQATVAMAPTGTSRKGTIVLAFIMSLFLGGMLAFVFEYGDPTFKSPQEAEKELNVLLLGTIPRRRRQDSLLIRNSAQKSMAAHFYHVLSDQLYLLKKEKNIKTVMFSSLSDEEGTSAVIANVGMFLSQRTDCRVLFVDANLRNPGLHRVLECENNVGLADIAEGRAVLKDVVCKLDKNVHVLTAGKTELNPVILLDAQAVSDLLTAVKDSYDIILIDCAPLRSGGDVSVLSAHVDTTAIVVSDGITRRNVLKTALKPLVDKEVPVLGVIMNNRTFPIPKFVYENV